MRSLGLNRQTILLLVSLLVLLVAVSVSADEDDYYTILGLDGEDQREEASDQEIKRKFRALSKKYHPDHNPYERDTYIKVQRAYEVLSNRKKRKIYDMKGEQGLKQLEESEKNPGRGHHDPFAQMFGMQGGGDRNKGKDMQLKVQMPLADLYNGNTHKITINKQKLCKKCRGTGAHSKADFSKCTVCKGKGVTIQQIQLAPGFVQRAEQPCQHCGGSGKMIKKKCTECRGQKVSRGDTVLEVDVEKGIPDGHQIVFDMEADQSPEVLPGDVIMIVSTLEDATFRRKGNNLETTLKISLRDALLGFTKHITHMDGRQVQVSQGDITQFGARIKVANEGMPKHNVPSEKGDLVVVLEYDMPRVLNEAQRELLDKLLV